MDGSSFATEGEGYPVFQMDGNMGGISAIMELLLQSHRKDVISVDKGKKKGRRTYVIILIIRIMKENQRKYEWDFCHHGNAFTIS